MTQFQLEKLLISPKSFSTVSANCKVQIGHLAGDKIAAKDLVFKQQFPLKDSDIFTLPLAPPPTENIDVMSVKRPGC